MADTRGFGIANIKKLLFSQKRIAEAVQKGIRLKDVDVVTSVDQDINDISKGTQTNDVKITLDSEEVVIGTGTNEIGNVKVSDGTDQVDVETLSDESHDIDGLKALLAAAALYARMDDDTVKPVLLDAVSHGLVITDFSHHETHEGDHYSFHYVDDDFDVADAIEFLIVTPNTTKWAHMVVSVQAELDTNVKLYEGATHTVAAAQTVYNRNRNSSNTNTTTVNTHNNDGADGTLIYENQFGLSVGGGAVGSSGGESRGDMEWILKQNEKYLLVVTSGTDNSSLSIRLSWYEHTSKN